MFDLFTESPFAFIGGFIIASLVLGAGIDWVRRQQVRDRQRLTKQEFGSTFFADHADVANRVRDVLAAHLSIDAGVIRPHDRLDDDLDVDIAANPDLFFELEEAFDIDCRVDEFEVFEMTTARLDTVGDLVGYVVEQIDEARSKPPRPKEKKTGLDGSDVVALGWFSGLVVFCAGAFMHSERIMALGLLIAFGPLAVGLARILLDVFGDFAVDVREIGMRQLLRRPFALIIWLIMVGFLIYVFGMTCLLLWKAFLGDLS